MSLAEISSHSRALCLGSGPPSSRCLTHTVSILSLSVALVASCIAARNREQIANFSALRDLALAENAKRRIKVQQFTSATHHHVGRPVGRLQRSDCLALELARVWLQFRREQMQFLKAKR